MEESEGVADTGTQSAVAAKDRSLHGLRAGPSTRTMPEDSAAVSTGSAQLC